MTKPQKSARADHAEAAPKKKAKAKRKNSGAKSVKKTPPANATETAEKHPGGRPTKYQPQYAQIARVMCSMGATDAELAKAFGVETSTIWRWHSSIPEFCSALRVEKGEFDERIKRSLAQRAAGYSYEAVKIFMPAGAKKPIYAAYMEHVPPDPNAAKIWLTNRQPAEWRDRKELTGLDGTPLVPALNVTYGGDVQHGS